MIDLRIGELLKEAGIATIVTTAIDGIKDGVRRAAPVAAEKVTNVVGEKITKKLAEEYRGELLAFIRSLASYDPVASENLMRRLQERKFLKNKKYGDKKPYKPGDEDRAETALHQLFKALDEPKEENTRRQTFIWLGRMEDEGFDSTLEFMHNDAIMQWVHRAQNWLKETGHGISDAVATHMRPANNTMEEYLHRQRAARGRKQRQYR